MRIDDVSDGREVADERAGSLKHAGTELHVRKVETPRVAVAAVVRRDARYELGRRREEGENLLQQDDTEAVGEWRGLARTENMHRPVPRVHQRLARRPIARTTRLLGACD